MKGRETVAVCLASGLLVAVGGCQPRLKIEPPDKPIVINLNIKIEQEVRIRVEKDVEELIQENPELF